MKKVILITGSTDGIGLITAENIVSRGHQVLLHGRSEHKLEIAKQKLLPKADHASQVKSYCADLSQINDVLNLADRIAQEHEEIDVLINNAGVFKTPNPITQSGLDMRFIVNTIAPYLLTQKLMPLMGEASRVINLSSAAQASVDLQALSGEIQITDDFQAYAQSKLALTMWSCYLAKRVAPIVLAVNPGSLLATKMVKEGFGMPGKDINIGANLLTRLALDELDKNTSGQYFDNDIGQFSEPHSDAMDQHKCSELVKTVETVLSELL